MPDRRNQPNAFITGSSLIANNVASAAEWLAPHEPEFLSAAGLGPETPRAALHRRGAEPITGKKSPEPAGGLLDQGLPASLCQWVDVTI